MNPAKSVFIQPNIPEFPPPRPNPSFPRGEVLSLDPPKGMRLGFPPKSGLLGLRDEEEEDCFEPELEDESEEFLRRRRFEPDDRGGDRELKKKKFNFNVEIFQWELNNGL